MSQVLNQAHHSKYALQSSTATAKKESELQSQSHCCIDNSLQSRKEYHDQLMPSDYKEEYQAQRLPSSLELVVMPIEFQMASSNGTTMPISKGDPFNSHQAQPTVYCCVSNSMKRAMLACEGETLKQLTPPITYTTPTSL